ncbi:MAG TPA: amylo-alpha-1,6-glucosidase [Burkholderiales bacterium]|nr:amylo-alpha-1,6-glucosidase [Burkholderiales bacterium]
MAAPMLKTFLPNFIRFGREICGNLAEAERREWWLGNGLGGYAAGTIAGTLTRRYHGLLIAPVNPPLGRYLVFAKADATMNDGRRDWPLATNRWSSGAVEPQGFVHIESFHLDGRMPVWRYAIGEYVIEQRIWLEPGANATYVAYRLEPNPLPPQTQLMLSVKLLINARDHHVNTRPGQFSPVIECQTQSLKVRHPNWFTLHFRACCGSIESRHDWYENFDLPVERERGLPDRDSHLCVGVATFELRSGEWAGFVASLSEQASPAIEDAMRRFHWRDAELLRRAKVQVPELIDAPQWVDQMALAANTFIFARPLPDFPDGQSVIAGYPWFGDWGRDTMIALPGITLATGQFDCARNILQTFAHFIVRGMLPNVFPNAGDTPEYNTVDAALWYIEAWRAYIAATRDALALRAVFPVLQEIIRCYRDGTRYEIGMDADALLRAGEPGVQLTWMDAKVGDRVVTPRIGKPVEINALWYNALQSMAQFATDLKQPAQIYQELAARTRYGFSRFINRENGGLYDVLDGPQGTDSTVRPNQIFAVSLPYSPLHKDTQIGVVRLCGRELLSSYGLRSLSPSHPDFHPYYVGGVMVRDGGYHQGPVWAWLLGHYVLAEYRVHGDAKAAQRRLEPLEDHLLDAALGNISEIFDGAPPHTPRGAPCQAWSVGCVLETWLQLERAKKPRTATGNTPLAVK